MSNHVRIFKPKFARLVESGAKLQTVRPTPKRLPKAGDTISLREWIGKPYRSKQRILRESEIINVKRIDISEHIIAVNSYAEPCEEFAKADGFKNHSEMVEWFKQNHLLPFEGIVIYWKPL